MKTKTLLFVLTLTLLSFAVYSQTQSGVQTSNFAQLMDLSVLPVTMPTLSASPNDSIFIEVAFKVNNKAMVSKAVYLFGTDADAGDILTTEVPFVKQGNAVYLQSTNSQKEVMGYNASVVIKLSKQQSSNFKYITVYVESPSGHISNKLYFEK